MNFKELGLIEPIVRAVADKGYETPSPIQALAIPAALEGRDILGCAQTGTGKTCAFALPILHKLAQSQPKNGPNHARGANQSNFGDSGFDDRGSKRRSKHHRNNQRQPMGRAPRALVLCPTRELATQIFESFMGYGQNLKLRYGVVFGGIPQRKQVQTLRSGVDVLVATPGRLLDLINQGHIDLSQIETLVLDEADRMLDMGFINDIRKVVDMIPEERQTLFFSATVSKEIRALTDRLLDDPAVIHTAPESTTAESIAQRIYTVSRHNKAELLERVLKGEGVGRALIFSRTKHGADKIVKVLKNADIDAEAIHGDKSQNARTRTMRRFKTGVTHVLVATDIASRGIDVDDITHVVNFDMPIDPETYVHRIGRTARAGATGIAISLCDHDELGIYRAIERRAKITIDVGTDQEDLTFEAPTSRFGGGGGNGGGNRRQHPRKRFGQGSGGRQGGGGRYSKPGNQDRSQDRGQDRYQSRDGDQDRSFEAKPGKPKFSKSGPNSGAKAGHRGKSKPFGKASGKPGGKPYGRNAEKSYDKPAGKPGSGVRKTQSSEGGHPLAGNTSNGGQKKQRVHKSAVSGGRPSHGNPNSGKPGAKQRSGNPKANKQHFGGW